MDATDTAPASVPLDSITVDYGLQSRAKMNAKAVEEYAAAMRLGAVFPPVVLFSDGTATWLADGFHRTAAARLAKAAAIAAIVKAGGRCDAKLYAASANGEHGLRRSDADKRHAVKMLLSEPEWAARSVAWIARSCHVSQGLVGKVCKQLGICPTTRATANGKHYPVRSAIGAAGPVPAPFPFYGSKGLVAARIWERLGDVPTYLEPFAGTAAVLLARPHVPRLEAIGDVDCLVVNFFRATAADPDAVAAYADWPLTEGDFLARWQWLQDGAEARALRKSIPTDPDQYNAKVAGWWCYCLSSCCFGTWPGAGDDKAAVVPVLGWTPTGVHRGAAGRTISPARDWPTDGACQQRREWLLSWFGRLRDRLRRVKVHCGDWRQMVDSKKAMWGLTGVFLDPPYASRINKARRVYANDSLVIAGEVREWCKRHGGNPNTRIVLAGRTGDGHGELERLGWSVVRWRAGGTWARRSEGLWFSPHCLPAAAA